MKDDGYEGEQEVDVFKENGPPHSGGNRQAGGRGFTGPQLTGRRNFDIQSARKAKRAAGMMQGRRKEGLLKRALMSRAISAYPTFALHIPSPRSISSDV